MSTKFGEVLVYTPFIGFGDLLYHTPLFRMLTKIYNGVDVWTFNPEPFLHNPDIINIFLLHTENDSNPTDFYHDKIFHIAPARNQMYKELFQSNMHMVDYYTLGTCGLMLRDFEKYLTINWLPEHVTRVHTLLAEHGLVMTPEEGIADFVVVNPACGWPSRTLPLQTYKEVISRFQEQGDKVVLVGKDINAKIFLPENGSESIATKLKRDENKTLYDTKEFPDTIDLTNILNFHECCYLYSLAKMALNTENGNMVASCTNDYCWNLYVPSLTAPEFRLPHRQGSMFYRTYVVHNPKNYYPCSNYHLLRNGINVINVETERPTVDMIYQGYQAISTAVKNNHNFLFT